MDNNDFKWEEQTTTKLLKINRDRWPDKVWMRKKDFGFWQTYTWKEGYQKIKDFSLGLKALGFQRGDMLAIQGDNNPQWFWGELAAQALGGAVAGVHSSCSPVEVEYLVNHCDASFILCQDQEQVDKQLQVLDKLPNIRKVIYWKTKGMRHYDEPILISDDSLIQGRVQIDATVRGVLQEEILGLVSERVFTRRLIQPGKSVSVSVRLDRGRLRQMLEIHPQAVLDIDFTLRMNVPQEEDSDRVTFSVKPVKASVHRPGAVVTTRGLNNQYSAIVMSDASSRVETGKLFLGLLREQAMMAAQPAPLYHFRYADWMPGRLTSAFASESGLLLLDTYQEWEGKTELMVNMLGMSLDGGISTAVARHLRNPAWPARMAALSVLSLTHGESFSEVLAWSKKYDTHPLVRRLAEALLAAQTQSPDAPNGWN